MIQLHGEEWRARWDLNPRSPAPQASVLIQPRLRAQFTGLRPKNQNLVINTLLRLKAAGLRETTIRCISHTLARLDKLCDLTKSEEVKLAIANLQVANSYKQAIIKAYNYTTINQIERKKQKYKHEPKQPTIPTRENLMKEISTTKKYAPIFKTIMETGLMPYELSQVQQKDIDFERGILSTRGYKGHTSRTFKLSQETTAMLKEYFTEYTKFPASICMQKMWRQHRNKVAKKLQDPNLHNIRLYDLRHYYATTLYARQRTYS